jgi:16S rRNA G966 N2-methylase RsmD
MRFAGVPGALLASGLLALTAVIGCQAKSSKLIIGIASTIMVPGILLLTYLFWLNSGVNAPIGVTVSPYKGLSYSIRIPGSEKLFGAWNEVSRVDVVAGASTRVMPGLSYTYPENPPPQYGLAIDAGSLQPITLIHPGDFSASDYLPEALAFDLRSQGKVLVIEPGGGLGVLQALSGDAKQVVVIASNSLLLEAVSESAADFNVYQDDRVQTKNNSARVFLNSVDDRFDLIFLPLTSPYRPVASGAYSLTETFNLTVEALTEMLSRLSEDGILIVTRWMQTPPSETLRNLTTIIAALEELDIDDPSKQIVVYRGVQTMTFLTKPGGWELEELEHLRKFLDQRRFDLVWAGDVSSGEVNRYNKLPEPVYFEAANEIISAQDRGEYIAKYPFDIQPATDDKPFFFHFFKWEQTPQIMATLGRIWQPFGGSGYFVLIALLVLVTGFSFLLIILPILLSRRRGHIAQEPGIAHPTFNWRVLVYFGSIGLAFLLIEIPLIQMGILLMEQPVYSFAIVVVTILIFSSFGSLLSRQAWIPKRLGLVLVFALTLITPVFVRTIQSYALGWPIIWRVLFFAVNLAPMGVAMGFPFPYGLEWLEKRERALIPWAWAVNGCASVIASVLAALLILNYGFTSVLFLGAAFYGVAAIVMKT